MEAIRRYDGLDFRLKAAKTRLLLLIMLMQLGRIGDVKPLLPPLRQALADGVLTDAQERADTEQALRMAEALLQAPPKVDTP
jgi:hypothetical protein